LYVQYDYAKTFVEWLNDKWSKQFDIDKSVPFAFRCVGCASSSCEHCGMSADVVGVR
jgi:hypothetical protein